MNQITQEDKFALRSCRFERLALEELKEDAEARGIGSYLRCKPLDGMPHSPNTGGGLDITVAQLDAFREKNKRQFNACMSAEREARKALSRINPTPVMYAYLLSYYIFGDDAKTAREFAKVSERQAQRYRQMIDTN